MTDLWVDKSSSLTTEQLNAKVVARLQFLKNELKKQGIHIDCGIELECFMLDENGQPNTNFDLARNGHSYITKDEFPLLDNLQAERTPGKYEIVLGTLGKDCTSFEPCIETARQLQSIKEKLPHRLKDKVPRLSFNASENFSEQATAGLHLSISARDRKGKNVFYDSKSILERYLHPSKPGIGFSPFAKRCAQELLKLQQDGLAIYAPNENSYKRFGAHSRAPNILGIAYSKGQHSIAMRSSMSQGNLFVSDADNPKPEYYRMEDRLAGADANPYLIMLANVGAIYSAVMHGKDGQQSDREGNQDREIPNYSPIIRRNVLLNLERSAIWREIAGEELHKDLVTHSQMADKQLMLR